MVDAVFGPVFRYFETFDAIADHGVLSGLPRVAAWRRMLAERPSVRAAAVPDYDGRLRAFLKDRDAHLLRLAA